MKAQEGPEVRKAAPEEHADSTFETSQLKSMAGTASPPAENPDQAGIRQLQASANASPGVRQLRALQSAADNSLQVGQLKTLQRRANEGAGGGNQPIIQQNENKQGLPDELRSGIESMSGMDMGDVRVHHNSTKPAEMQALAYAQGNDIHLGPGQEQHLPHEAWHVVQQRQGRVQPTLQMKGDVAVNDDQGLEHEADVMGQKALQMKGNASAKPLTANANSAGTSTVQCVLGLSRGERVKFFDKATGTVLAGTVEDVAMGSYTISVLDGPMPDDEDEMPPLASMHDVEQLLVFPEETVSETILSRFSMQVMMGQRILIDNEHFGSSSSSDEPRRMGGNLDFVRGSQRDFLFTDGGRGNMQLDLTEGGKLDQQMGKHKAASKAPKGLFNSAPSLMERFQRLLGSVHAIPTNKEERDEQVLSGSEDLGTMLERGHTMCWEKAAFMHLLLTDLGIECEILSGEMHTKKSAQHAWVGIVGTDLVVEATAGFVALRSNYEKAFTVNQQRQIARPTVRLSKEEVGMLLVKCGKFKEGFIPSSN
jgi:hypothetical protein